MKLRPNGGRPSSPRGSTRMIRMGMRSCVGLLGIQRYAAVSCTCVDSLGIISLGADECREGSWCRRFIPAFTDLMESHVVRSACCLFMGMTARRGAHVSM